MNKLLFFVYLYTNLAPIHYKTNLKVNKSRSYKSKFNLTPCHIDQHIFLQQTDLK